MSRSRELFFFSQALNFSFPIFSNFLAQEEEISRTFCFHNRSYVIFSHFLFIFSHFPFLFIYLASSSFSSRFLFNFAEEVRKFISFPFPKFFSFPLFIFLSFPF